MKTEEMIYKLKLHEKIYLQDEALTITRVAGGWVYCFSAYSIDQMSCVFVPLNNEFTNQFKKY